MPYTHDLIIMGAGIVGSSMALAAAQQGLTVALLDKQAPSLVSDVTNLRVSNINFKSEQFLNNLGVVFPAKRRGIFKQIKIWQENNLATLNFQADLLHMPYLGSIIENNVLVAAIQAAFNHKINCYWPREVQKLILTSEGVSATSEGLHDLRAPLIIGAEGAHSYLRAHCGIRIDEKPYQQTALVAHIATARSHEQTAYQRFLTTGPLAYLPLSSAQQCSIVWSSTPDHMAHLMALNDAALAAEIASGMQHYLGEVELISQRATFPLVMRHARHYIAPRVALIGDAIHTLHPLAGQGANLGLMDVASLVKNLVWAKQQQRDLGSLTPLRRYERERRFANTLMLQAIQLLAQNQQPFSSLRALGINMVEHSTFLKQMIMRYAQGV